MRFKVFSCRVVPAGGVAGPTSSDLWCAPSACLHLLQLFWVAAGKCWHVVSWAPRLRTSGALPRPARTSLQRPAMAPSPGASWLGLAHLVALLALRGLPSAGLLCPSFTPDADKHRAPGLLSQLPGPANRQQRKRLTPALLVAWATCPAPLATWGRALPTPSWRRYPAAWAADAAALLAAASARRPTRGHRPLAHRWAARGSPWQSTLRAALAGNVLPLPASVPLTAFSALSQDARPACLAAAAGPPMPL